MEIHARIIRPKKQSKEIARKIKAWEKIVANENLLFQNAGDQEQWVLAACQEESDIGSEILFTAPATDNSS